MLSGAPDRMRCPRSDAALMLRRAWPRDVHHLLCEYTTPDGAPVAGQWFADPARLHTVAAGTRGDLDVLEKEQVLLQRGGADRRLPALHALVGAPGAALLVHRPERRAVVRLPAGDAIIYAKVVRPERAVELAERSARATRQTRSGAFRTPALRSLDHTHGILVLEELSGRSLFALGATPQAATAWTAAGTALARLHDGELEDVPTHLAADEADLTQRWLSRAAAFGLLPLVDSTRALSPLREDRTAPVGLLHRDLHDKQLIHRPGTPIGVLDTDTLAAGERALDIANLLVHLELRVRQRRLPADTAATARRRFLAAYRPDDETRRRLPAYATAARLRLAAVYAFRPPWHHLAHELLAAAVNP